MTRYVMTIDLRRCVGCQTCTAACKGANATPPGIQWRRVLDIESGEFPDVRRTFLPVACMHCGNPPCEQVCPTRATTKRADGLVAIDYDLCIGCANCVMACPYDARSIVHEPHYAYSDSPMASEAKRFDPDRVGVSMKCTFCKDRIELAERTGRRRASIRKSRRPASIPASPAPWDFGDIEDGASSVRRLLAETQHFRMHEELGTEPSVYYVWDKS
jgi:phenylacetyl-CoA:acceptor oxidoreductase subunit 1